MLPFEKVKQKKYGKKSELKNLVSFFSQSNGRKAIGAQLWSEVFLALMPKHLCQHIFISMSSCEKLMALSLLRTDKHYVTKSALNARKTGKGK